MNVEELWFVSSQRPLKDGKVGPRIVAHTEGVSQGLAKLLVSLSTYPAAAFPAPVYSHVTFRTGETEYSVLSKLFPLTDTKEGGIDYFAQHLVIPSLQRPRGGPAYLLGQPSLFLTRWDGRTGRLTYRKELPDGEDTPVRCERWEEHAGDAGWAGVVLRHFSDSRREPVYLIAGPEIPVIHMLRELMAHAPAPVRWTITFSTYQRELPEKIKCQLRVLDPLEAAFQAPSEGDDALVIDLTKPKPCHVIHEMVQLTRRGSRVGGRGIFHGGTQDRREPSARSARAAMSVGQQRASASEKGRRRSGRRTASLGAPSLEGIYAEIDRHERSRKRWLLIKRIAGRVIAVLLVGAIAAGGYFGWRYYQQHQAGQAQGAAEQPSN